jgi:hypothetical protein
MPIQPALRARVEKNIARVANLVKLYDDIAGTGQGRRPMGSSDVLRAATVLLHASLEDLLRGLAARYLPTSTEEALNSVPLVGLPGRAEKFMLGALAAHRGKSVDTVIKESVDEHLSTSNYNNTGEISRLLTSLGIAPGQVNGRFGDLSELMSRRHHIVHVADANDQQGQGQHAARSLGKHTVRRWIEAVEEFLDAIDAAVP